MKAVRYYGIHDVRFEEIAKPEPAEGEVLIRVAYGGICGSDLHIYNRQMFIQNIPETMGHEFSGTVEAIGKGVTGEIKPGDKVTAVPMVTCGRRIGCRSGYPNTCDSLGFIGEVRPGGFAEYISMPAEDIIKIPSDGNLKDMVLAEPLAVALNICELAGLSHTDKKDRLAVIGAGPIGLLTLILARQYYGVRRVDVTGRSQFRLDLAKKLGACLASGSLPDGSFYETVVEAAGKKKTMEMAAKYAAPNGDIIIASVFEDPFEFDFNSIVVRQLRLIGCSAYEKRHMEKAVEIIADGSVDLSGIITSTFRPEDCGEAFARASAKEKHDAKIVFDMQQL